MIVDRDMGGDTPDGVNFFLGMEQFASPSKNNVLLYGINSTLNRGIQKLYEAYEHRKLLNYWTPCEFAAPPDTQGQDGIQATEFFTRVYDLCPYSCNWINELLGEEKYIYRRYFLDPNTEPGLQEKKWDVCYFGGIHGTDHQECIDQISRFNHKFLCQYSHPGVTDLNVPFHRKMEIIATTKMTVNYHFVVLMEKHKYNLKSYIDWQENVAFSHVDSLGIMPQFKQRMNEAAISRTLNLVKRDPWNVVEDYYVPDQEFIYFDDNSQLPELISEVLKDWDTPRIGDIIEAAYAKVLTHNTASAFAEMEKV